MSGDNKADCFIFLVLTTAIVLDRQTGSGYFDMINIKTESLWGPVVSNPGNGVS